MVKYFRLSRGRPGFDSPLRSLFFVSSDLILSFLRMLALTGRIPYVSKLCVSGLHVNAFSVAGPY